MTDAQEISEVRWDDFWDRTLEQQVKEGKVGFSGDLRNPRGDWVLFTPGRLLVDERVAGERAVAEAIGRADAQLARSGESEAARAVAARLGLSLFETSNDRVLDAVRDVNRAVARSASLDHVLIGGPARWGGDSVPVPISDPGTVPGSDPALGKGITVAVLDTGIAKVPFPTDAGAAGTDNAEVPDADGDGHRDAPAGHGTHVAGLVVSVAAATQIVVRRVLTGVGGMASEIEVAGALLDNAHADIINCSFSGPVLDDGVPRAIDRALAQLPPTTVVVACAGNHGSDRPQWPAASKRVIAVGAIQRIRGEQRVVRPDFTNFGSWVDCCAPGVDVPSTFLGGIDGFEGFARWTGTSMACPQVAGAIAAIASRDGVDVRTAAYCLVQDPARPRMPDLGTIVDPANLP